MYRINEKTQEIQLTRGDIACIEVGALNEEDKSEYEFKAGDIVRFKVFKKKDCGCVELQKDVEVKETTKTVEINLTSDDTKIGDIINDAVDYWYEVELNPDTNPQTIIAYEVDEYGQPLEKIFKLLPEGNDKE